VLALGLAAFSLPQQGGALKLEPTFTAQMWRATSIQSDPRVTDGQVDDLIEAGLPEK